MNSLNYNDVYLIPTYSTLESRSNVDLSVELFKHPKFHTIKMPVIAANMKTVTGAEMATTLYKLGAMGILHRFQQTHDGLKNDCQFIFSNRHACSIETF